MALDSHPQSAGAELPHTLLNEFADFGEGIFHGAVENPINGAVQLVNHVSGAQLPELHLVDEDEMNNTIGGKLGTAVGGAADLIGLTLATGGLGGTGMVISTLRTAAVGAAYSGIFQPTDANSKDFFEDRLKNAAVTGVAIGALSASAGMLGASGLFSAPAERGFVETVGYNATAGAISGVVRSEANAVFKENRAVPTYSELTNSVESYVAFGAAFGAASYGVEQAFGGPAPAPIKQSARIATMRLWQTIPTLESKSSKGV